MRIHTNGTDVDAFEAVRTEATQGESTTSTRRAAQPAAVDQVELSSSASLAGRAIKAAAASPDVRADVVARARQLLEAGEVGSDALRLADALIDRTIRKD